MDHLLLTLWHAFLVALFFAFLWRTHARARWRLFVKTYLIMVLGGIVLGWLMYFFP